MFSMNEQERKPILFKHYFLYVVYDGLREKTHSFIIVFFMLSMMEQGKKLILLQPDFFYVIYDGTKARTHSVVTLFFLCCV